MKIISPSLPHRVISGGNKTLEEFELLLCSRVVKSWDISSLLFFLFFTQLISTLCAKAFLEMRAHSAELCIAVSPEPAGKGQRFQAAPQSLFHSDLSDDNRGRSPKLDSLDIPCFAVTLGSPFIPSSFLLLCHHHLSPSSSPSLCPFLPVESLKRNQVSLGKKSII